MRRNTLKMSLIAVGVAIAVGAAVMGLRQHEAQADQQPATRKAVLSVKITQAQQLDWPITLKASGPIVAWQEAIISAETGNLRIAALHADVGQRVKKGELLAELASDAVRADLRRYEAALASAKADLAQAKTNAERARSIKGSGAMSDQKFLEYMIAEETALAAVDQAAAQVAAQKITLAQTRILAVDDGIVTAKSALLGQVVSVGTELFRLQRQGRLEWQAEVDATQLSQVRAGAKAEVTLPSGAALSGVVRLVAPTLSTSTSRANILVSLAPGATAGMFVNGTIDAGRHTVLAVPQSAVVLRDGISYVFEVSADENVVQHRVDTGAHHDGLVEIASGIQAGMSIAASGGAFLADGDRVSVAKGVE